MYVVCLSDEPHIKRTYARCIAIYRGGGSDFSVFTRLKM